MSTKWLAPLISKVSVTPVYSTIIPTLTNQVLIGTHDGSFHCDEALAVSMLQLLPRYETASVVRSRDHNFLAHCDIVVDVGAKYEPERNLFDHHQREFSGVLDSYNTKLSSAGLVYKHFGKDIIREICTLNDLQTQQHTASNKKLIDILYQRVYKSFIEHIDAIDNGIAVSDGPLKYHVSTTLSSRVGNLNPSWNQPQSHEVYSEQFQQAMALTCSEFLGCIDALLNIWWPARSLVETSIAECNRVHASGSIVVLSQFCPWKDHLFEIETEMGVEGQLLYVLYQDVGGSWRIQVGKSISFTSVFDFAITQAVPEDPHSFACRRKLPAPWCGLRDEELSIKTGIPDCIFVHSGGFIGGHKTFEGALALAVQSVEFKQ